MADDWGADARTGELLRITVKFKELARRFPEALFTVRHRGRYSHEFCTEFDVDSGLEGAAGDAAESEIIGLARQFMRWIYRYLEYAYDDFRSDDSVGELLNDYEFTADGRPFRHDSLRG